MANTLLSLVTDPCSFLLIYYLSFYSIYAFISSSIYLSDLFQNYCPPLSFTTLTHHLLHLTILSSTFFFTTFFSHSALFHYSPSIAPLFQFSLSSDFLFLSLSLSLSLRLRLFFIANSFSHYSHSFSLLLFSLLLLFL